MSKLKRITIENAAGGSVGAGSFAGTRGSLFGGNTPISRVIPDPDNIQTIELNKKTKNKKKNGDKKM